ncbi:MAG: hypothetical protein ACRD2Y_13850 [Terriglobales bacterium]
MARTAIIVFHGMGQQVPFQTLDAVARLIAAPNQPSAVRLVHDGQGTLPVAEISVTKDGSTKEVDLYEAYWAPLTEGQIAFREAASFLLGAGGQGLWHCIGSRGIFTRRMFDRDRRLPIPASTTVSLVVALFVTLSLFLILSSAVWLAYGMATGQESSALARFDQARPLLVAVVVITLAIALVLIGVPVFLACLWPWRHWRHVTQVGAALVLLNVMGGAVSISLKLLGMPWEWAFWLVLLPKSLTESRLMEWISMTLLLLLAWMVRRFLVQSVGDVAIYVSSHQLNRFHRVREEIKKTAMRVASAVYGSADPHYSRVLLVGHSLGSVIAYDTLNALLVNDRAGARGLNVAQRTKLLLTFGSPLDKTAFIFRNQLREADFREALAEAKQPLIQTYTNRTMRWVNIYTLHDWIGGQLDFYDDPEYAGEGRVDNREDPEGLVPLKAHTDYWSHEELRLALVEAL